MKKQTPMQEHIKELEKILKGLPEYKPSEQIEIAIISAKSFLEKEKETIESAYGQGLIEVPNYENTKGTYYEKTFQNNQP